MGTGQEFPPVKSTAPLPGFTGPKGFNTHLVIEQKGYISSLINKIDDPNISQ